MDNISKKILSSKNKDEKSYLKEIMNHLKDISIGINSSEIDFKDILGEEFKEENKMISELFNDIQILKSKMLEVEKLGKTKEKANKELLKDLSEEISRLSLKISDNYNNLPIGSPVNLPYEGLTLASYGSHLANNFGLASKNLSSAVSDIIFPKLSQLTIDMSTEKDQEKKNNK